MRSCRPVERALVDLWHADERGEYDTAGYRYRGHLFTDREGRYRFRTILPALYPGRTRHYHVKVQVPERPVLTTELYFPDEPIARHSALILRLPTLLPVICIPEIAIKRSDRANNRKVGS